MLIFLSKETKQVIENLGTNSLFPNGDIPNFQPKENEIFVKLYDDSELAKRIMTAADYELALDEFDNVIDVIVHKTLEEYQAEQPIIEPVPSEFEELTNYVLDVDMRLIMIEMNLI